VPESVAPPQNAEAEAMLLASLMAADTYVAEAMSVVSREDFYREGHRAVFRAIEALFGAGEPVEPTPCSS
jgi:replicative DNA helicase